MQKSILLSIIAVISIIYYNSNDAQCQIKRTLSDDAYISLLTATQGDELYSVFGHSAVRVYDPQNNTDLVFNYGTFDFNTSNFYLKFIRGKLLYKLSVGTMGNFLPEYIAAGRGVYEQILDLDYPQKQKMFDFLIENAQPENAYYHYDFFYDNCATRIRDLAETIVSPNWASSEEINDQSLGYVKQLLDYDFNYNPGLEPATTLRALLQPFLVSMPWSRFGIDLALGLPADKVATNRDRMYLPDEMLVAFALAKFPDGRSLVKEHRVLNSLSMTMSPASPITPLRFSLIIFFLALVSLTNKRYSHTFDKILFTTTGLIGIAIIFLWFFTDHVTTKVNINILWAVPMNLYFIWKLISPERSKTVKSYFTVLSFIYLLLLVFWWMIPQGFNEAFFWIIAAMLVKTVANLYKIPFVTEKLHS